MYSRVADECCCRRRVVKIAPLLRLIVGAAPIVVIPLDPLADGATTIVKDDDLPWEDAAAEVIAAAPAVALARNSTGDDDDADCLAPAMFSADDLERNQALLERMLGTKTP